MKYTVKFIQKLVVKNMTKAFLYSSVVLETNENDFIIVRHEIYSRVYSKISC